MPFKFTKMHIPDLFYISSTVFNDERGYFFEGFKASEFESFIPKICQSNFSVSKKGVIRGLHFQKAPFAQGKLISCLKGSIFDVVVDLRENSPFYGQYLTFNLKENEQNLVYCPPGFAHGFQALTDDTMVMYGCTAEYNQNAEDGIIYNDKDLSINWPLNEVLLSKKDKQLQTFKEFTNEQNNKREKLA